MPTPELLETFPNPYADRDYEIFMTCPEFTSLCPLGGIESDTDEEGMEQIVADEWEILRTVLKTVGVSTEQLPLKPKSEWRM